MKKWRTVGINESHLGKENVVEMLKRLFYFFFKKKAFSRWLKWRTNILFQVSKSYWLFYIKSDKFFWKPWKYFATHTKKNIASDPGKTKQLESFLVNKRPEGSQTPGDSSPGWEMLLSQRGTIESQIWGSPELSDRIMWRDWESYRKWADVWQSLEGTPCEKHL